MIDLTIFGYRIIAGICPFCLLPGISIEKEERK
jgi:hypothetical protein